MMAGTRARRCKRSWVWKREWGLQHLEAQAVVSKYGDHLPLYRQEGIFERHGLAISRKTLCDWVLASAHILEPVVDAMKARILQSKVMHTDDTPVTVLEPGTSGTHQGRFWVYLGDGDSDAVLIECACWAHCRRYFYNARTSDPVRSHQVLGWVRQLYDIERDAKESTAEDRRAMRQAGAKPILDDLKQWFDAQQGHVLPKSPRRRGRPICPQPMEGPYPLPRRRRHRQ